MECWKPTFPQGVNGTGVRVTKANHRGKTEPLPCLTNQAVNQAKENVKIVFKLSIVECSVSLNVSFLTMGDRTSKKQ